MIRLRPIAVVWIVGLLTACESDNSRPIRQVNWSLSGPWVVVDTHTHSTFSDGAMSVAEVGVLAQAHGCGAIAITDHSHPEYESASEPYFDALRDLRNASPQLIVIAGLEWNIPPYGGREHVNVLVEPGHEQAVLSEFKQRFQDDAPDGQTGLAWLDQATGNDDRVVAFYNHPSRKDELLAENQSDFLAWREAGSVLAGFEGGVGHQQLSKALGAYQNKFELLDRWDPVVATVGGIWDDILSAGTEAWSALAVSDFHNLENDFAPCEFSRTHVQVPEKSAAGVIRALRAGTFWADQGRILDRFDFLISVPGLELPLSPGESAYIKPGESLRWTATIRRGPGAADKPLDLEVIGNCRAGAVELLFSPTLQAGEQSAEGLISRLEPGRDGRTCYLRARARRVNPDGADLMAYTNSIRLVLHSKPGSSQSAEAEPPTPQASEEPESQDSGREPLLAEPELPELGQADEETFVIPAGPNLDQALVDEKRIDLENRRELALSEAQDRTRRERENLAAALLARIDSAEQALQAAKADRIAVESKIDGATPDLSDAAAGKVESLSSQIDKAKSTLAELSARYTEAYLRLDPKTQEIRRRIRSLEADRRRALADGAAQALQAATDTHADAKLEYESRVAEKDGVLARFDAAVREAETGRLGESSQSETNPLLWSALEKLNAVWKPVYAIESELEDLPD